MGDSTTDMKGMKPPKSIWQKLINSDPVWTSSTTNVSTVINPAYGVEPTVAVVAQVQQPLVNNTQPSFPIQTFVTNKMDLAKRTAASLKMTTILASFVPDYVLNNDFPKIPYDTTIDCVALVCDVSGFTALTEAYSLKGKGGTDQLTKILSSYMSPLAQCILLAGGDIIKYAGDAILAIWRIFDTESYYQEIQKVVDCALYIQEAYGSFYCTDVDITIRVKFGIGAGKAYQCVMGNNEYHHFVTFGPGVGAASEAEHNCEKGDVIVAGEAWELCKSSDFSYEKRGDGFIKIKDILTFVNPELRGRPTKEQIKAKITVLRPSVAAALETKSEAELRPYVIPPVHKILDSDLPLDYLNESRQTCICFIKLELKPFDPNIKFVDSMLAIVQMAFKHIFQTAKLTGGSLTKIIMFDKGLTYLVVFGLPGYIHSNQSANALEFSYRVKGLIMKDIKYVSEVSLGVTSGTTYCGCLGHSQRQEYTVIGQMVNKAARLMCNYPGIVSCDQDTLFHSKRPLHHFSLLPFKALKGIAATGHIYEYLGAESGEDQTVKLFEYPMVNREQELQYFRVILDSAEAEFAQFIQAHRLQQGDYDLRATKEIHASGLWMLVLEGDVGMGKSRLLSAFVHAADNRSLITFSLTMNMLRTNPYSGIRSLLYQAFGIEEMTSAQEREDHFKKTVLDDPDLTSGLCLLNEILEMKLPLHPKYQTADLNSRHLYSQHIIGSLLRHFWPDRLIIFLVDDAHLLDLYSWDHLYYISHSPCILVICSILRTPSGTPKLADSVNKIIYNQKNVKPLKVPALDPNNYSLPLACQMMEVIAIPVELEKILQQKSQGVPAWIEQVTSEMIRTGLLKILPYDIREATRRQMKLSLVTPKYIQRMDYKLKVNKQKPGYDWRSDDISSNSSTFISIKASHTTTKLAETARRVQKELTKPETRMCVVRSDTNLSSTPIPGTLKEILLDMFDELNPNEQMLLKCATVLGSRFSRAMLIRLIPLYEVNALNYENGFRSLMEVRIIRCASTPHGPVHLDNEETGKAKVDCFCRFTKEEILLFQTMEIENDPLERVAYLKDYKYKHCKFMQFSKENLIHVVYELMTEDLRKELHLTAAKYLDTSIIRCRVHGGEETAYLFGFTMKGGDVGNDHEEALRAAAGQGRRRASFYGATQALASHTLNMNDKEKPEELHHHHMPTKGAKPVHETSRSDMNRRVYEAKTTKVAGIEANVLEEIENFMHHGKKSFSLSLFCTNCVKKKKTENEPNEYDLKIKKLAMIENENVSDVTSEQFNNVASNISKEIEVIDLRGCTCTNIQSKVCVEMVKHYRQAEKYGKCLVNLLEAGESAVAIGNSGQALIHLEDTVALMDAIRSNDLPAPLPGDPDDLAIDEEEVNIQLEFLYGLSYFELGIHVKARDYFLKSLKRFGMDIPHHDDRIKVAAQTVKLNSKLWHRHIIGFSCCGPHVDDSVEVDPLTTLKLRILTYLQVLYKVDRKSDSSLLVSLWQVLTAEEGSGSYQDILPAYCTMMETYSLMSDHKKAALYEKLALKAVRNTFWKVEHVQPMALYTAACVFSTISFIRLLRGEIDVSINSAYLSLRIARTMHDNTIAMQVYPRLAISLMLNLRISEVVEVLQKLWYTSDEEEDWDGVALYWTLCLNLLLNTAYPMEPYTSCEHFVSNCDWGADVRLYRLYEVQYNVESSIALWNCRFSRWELAQKWMEKAGKSKPKQVNFFTVEAQLKLLECELIFVNHHLEAKRYQHFAKSRNSAKQLMTSLELNSKRVPVLMPRFMHLLAYYCRIRARNNEAEKYLKRAVTMAQFQGNAMEIEWICHSRTVWEDIAIPTIKYFWLEHTENNTLDWHQSSKVPWANIMYSLPLPTWK